VTDFDEPTVLSAPSEVLGMVPYLLGFHPADSIITVLLKPGGRVIGCSRHSLHLPPQEIIDDLRAVIGERGITALVVAGYGPPSARAAVTGVSDALHRDLPVHGRLLVSDGRCYCLREGCGCLPEGGIAFDAHSTAYAAQAAVDGQVALPTREDVVTLAAPDSGAQHRVQAAIDQLPPWRMCTLAELMGVAQRGGRLDDRQVAELAEMLRCGPDGHDAWQATGGSMWQRDLWLDVTRRVPDAYVARPAALAAWCAWRRGEETVAQAAIDRILDAGSFDLVAAITMLLLENHADPDRIPWPMPAGSLLPDPGQQGW
jgi:hypothetical protein